MKLATLSVEDKTVLASVDEGSGEYRPLLLDDAPWRVRLGRAALGAVAAGAAGAAAAWTGGRQVAGWLEALQRVLVPVNLGGRLLRQAFRRELSWPCAQ